MVAKRNPRKINCNLKHSVPNACIDACLKDLFRNERRHTSTKPYLLASPRHEIAVQELKHLWYLRLKWTRHALIRWLCKQTPSVQPIPSNLYRNFRHVPVDLGAVRLETNPNIHRLPFFQAHASKIALHKIGVKLPFQEMALMTILATAPPDQRAVECGTKAGAEVALGTVELDLPVESPLKLPLP
ncbi:uncharacterized protein BDR25DRAFT_360232 [Lindgomyces ingoldianus]|uniref:Uncharacterized protein n=1 Tax=Lindgomyces ingoldianus TaxID=673940 RepID=A0ACB6QHW5_9PLEO|nr:uncharacterized protein BDR25DRAFT_360232 [Lindgomyces ingoldianus]KAF2465712.1 hypothetical protein BDR25DRAFT_360232 [Lindgomyces ingoldianus]